MGEEKAAEKMAGNRTQRRAWNIMFNGFGLDLEKVRIY